MIMNLANILKIAYAASKATEMGGYLASGGKANQLSNIASVVGQAAGAAGTVVNATNVANTSPGGAAKPPTQTPKTDIKVPEVPTPKIGSTTTIGKPNSTGLPSMQRTADHHVPTNALKVNPGGYTKPELQKAYLDGLKLSGAKLNKAGQIVKPDGQAFKKAGWDIQARGKALEGVDASRRKDLITEAQGYINKLKTKAVDVRKAVSPETPTKPTSTKMKVQPKSDKTVSTPVSKDLSENLVIGTYPDGTPKSAKQIDKELGGTSKPTVSKTKSKSGMKQVPKDHWSGMGGLWVDEDWNWENDTLPRGYLRGGEGGLW